MAKQIVLKKVASEMNFVAEEIQISPPKEHEIQVDVQAISINPVDTKQRSNAKEGTVLGWDASGIVRTIGAEVNLFEVGDEVYYAGALQHSGSYTEVQNVDERLVGHKPLTLSFSEAAALPLTTLTAYEALFEKLQLPHLKTHTEQHNPTLLIINGAGGVGSIAIQLAKEAQIQVIATASRPETKAWTKKMGADFVINHHEDMMAQLEELDFVNVDAILCLSHTDQHFAAMAEMIKPNGRICSIVETKKPVELDLLKAKSVTFSWEFMFTKALYQTDDMATQGRILNEVAHWVDDGAIQTTMTEEGVGLSAETLTQAHEKVADDKMIGKLVIKQ